MEQPFDPSTLPLLCAELSQNRAAETPLSTRTFAAPPPEIETEKRKCTVMSVPDLAHCHTCDG